MCFRGMILKDLISDQFAMGGIASDRPQESDRSFTDHDALITHCRNLRPLRLSCNISTIYCLYQDLPAKCL